MAQPDPALAPAGGRGPDAGSAERAVPARRPPVARTQVAVLGWLAPVLVATLMATVALQLLTWSDRIQPLGNSRVADLGAALGFLSWSAVGGLVVMRRPGNRVGLVLLAAGLAGQAWVLLAYYAGYGLLTRPGSLPAAGAAAVATMWLPTAAFGLAFTFLFLLFPDGRLPSRGWSPFAGFAAAAVAILVFTWATAPGPLEGSFAGVVNPLGIGLVGRIDPGLGWGLFVLAVVGSVAAPFVRLRRSTGVARQQLKWFTYAAALVAVTWVAVTIGSGVGPPVTTVAGVMYLVAIGALPLAVFTAIFRYNLYDIDLVISRTIVVGSLAVLVTGGYVAVVTVVGMALGRAGEIGLGVSVLATALVAVAFQPARVRAHRLADRLVYGRRATPYEVLAELARRVGDGYAAEDLLPQLASTLAQGTGALRVEVWLLADRRLRRAGCWPADERAVTMPLAGDGGLPAFPHATEVATVRHQGELAGALVVTLPAGHSLSTVERRLLADLAAQAGLALDNLRLIAELKASRLRIVAAQDEERRRIERDIHDGVQQRLVSLSLALRMAGASLRPSPAAAVTDTLDRAADEARVALAELRRLARGIHPAIVSEGGLVAALESLAERSQVPVEVAAVPPARLPAAVEVTVYYLVAEALANVAKHAKATAARVRVDRSGGKVRVEVTDDGIGGAVAGAGSGLTGLTDRVAALDGTFTVVSPGGRGTTVRAEIPCAS